MKRNLITRLTRSALLTGALVFQLTQPALAQPANIEIEPADIAAAEAHAASAYAAFVAKDYEAAVELYLKAYEAAPSPDILYNIARVYEMGLGDRANAVKFYRDVVSDPSAEPRRVALASARLHELVGGAEATARPSAASGASGADAAAPAALAEIDRASLAAAPSVGGSLHAESSSPRPWSAWRRSAVVTGGVGLVAMGFGAVFGAKALSQAKTVRAECDGNVCSSERGLSAAHSATRNADVATLSFAAGGLLLATGATLLGIDLGTSHDARASHAFANGASANGAASNAAERPAVARWTATVTRAEVRLGLSGRW